MEIPDMDFYEMISVSRKLTSVECDNLHKYVDASKLIIVACKLKLQRIESTRDGMIDALKSSLNVAYKNRQSEAAGSNPYVSPQYIQFEQLTNKQLYSLLPKYLKGLELHCINEFGKELYEKCVEIVWEYVIENENPY